MCRHQALDALAAVGVRRDGAPGQHVFEDKQQLLGNLIVSLIAGVMEGDEDFIGQASAITGRATALP